MLKLLTPFIALSLPILAQENDEKTEKETRPKERTECDFCRDLWRDGGVDAVREMLINQDKE